MNIEKRSARFGAAVLIFSLLLRLVGAVATPQARAESLSRLEGLVDYFNTGRKPHRGPGGVSLGSLSAEPTETVPTLPSTVPTMPTQPPKPAWIRFSSSDMAYVNLQYGTDCSYRTEPERLLLQPLHWQMESEEPTVLIVHSHATESYTKAPGQTYQESGSYRTKDTDHNMVAVGDALASLLRARGIGVIHDRQLHDHPSYNAAYTNSRKSVEAYLEEYPTICMVLDLHRDAALNADGSQYATSATVNGERSAQLMLLAGTDSVSGKHPNWQENLALALKLQALLEKENPGITRRTLLRGYVFNQDLCSGMLIVEVGTAGNTLQEALRAMAPLADAIAALKHGANREG